jgi:hypothetical protein
MNRLDLLFQRMISAPTRWWPPHPAPPALPQLSNSLFFSRGEAMAGDGDALESRGAGYEELQEAATDLGVCRTADEDALWRRWTGCSPPPRLGMSLPRRGNRR